MLVATDLQAVEGPRGEFIFVGNVNNGIAGYDIKPEAPLVVVRGREENVGDTLRRHFASVYGVTADDVDLSIRGRLMGEDSLTALQHMQDGTRVEGLNHQPSSVPA